MSAQTQLLLYVPDDVPDKEIEKHVEEIKDDQHVSGKVYLPDQVQDQNECQDAYGIRFENAVRFCPPAQDALCRIHVERVIKEKIKRHYKDEESHIVLKRKSPYAFSEKACAETEQPGYHV